MDERNVDVREKKVTKKWSRVCQTTIPLCIGRHLDDLDRPSKSSSVLSACSFYRSTWEGPVPPPPPPWNHAGVQYGTWTKYVRGNVHKPGFRKWRSGLWNKLTQLHSALVLGIGLHAHWNWWNFKWYRYRLYCPPQITNIIVSYYQLSMWIISRHNRLNREINGGAKLMNTHTRVHLILTIKCVLLWRHNVVTGRVLNR